jgi:predicted nucleic acid-binding protein
MIILDTTIWIEFLKKHEPYFSKISSLLEKAEILAVECVFGELLQGVRDDEEQNIILEYWTHLPKMEFPESIIEAGIYSRKNSLWKNGVGLIDAIILVHGIQGGIKIWTLDKKFLNVIPEELKYDNQGRRKTTK